MDGVVSPPWEISQAPNEKIFYYEEIWTIFELEPGEGGEHPRVATKIERGNDGAVRGP